MFLSTKLESLALLAIILPSALAQTIHNVTVAPGGKLVYDPEFVIAEPGDVIQFTFNPKAHTVTQSTFDTPCIASPGGATTGFVPVDANTSPLPIRLLTVPEGDAPLWFYCAQVGHCGQGMVFAINPPADPDPHSFANFKALAIKQNGTSTTAPATTLAFSTPPPQSWATATATVTQDSSTWTTTYTSYAGSLPPTPGPQGPVDHKIEVGPDGSLTYNPASIQANVGDTVTFEFKAKNHTVTQSSFNNPCERVTLADGTPGFASGFRPVDANTTELPTFTITINDTTPIWGYCGQTGHCGQGMVFAINAVESGPNNFANFQTIAKNTAGNSTSSGSTGGSGSSTGNGNNGNGKSAASSLKVGGVLSTIFLAGVAAALF